MLPIEPELQQRYSAFLAEKGVAVELRPHFLTWLRFYLDFCQKYGLDSTDRRSFPPFDEKLEAKGQSEAFRRQARSAVAAYYRVISGEPAPARPAQSSPHPASPRAPSRPSPAVSANPVPTNQRTAAPIATDPPAARVSM